MASKNDTILGRHFQFLMVFVAGCLIGMCDENRVEAISEKSLKVERRLSYSKKI